MINYVPSKWSCLNSHNMISWSKTVKIRLIFLLIRLKTASIETTIYWYLNYIRSRSCHLKTYHRRLSYFDGCLSKKGWCNFDSRWSRCILWTSGASTYGNRSNFPTSWNNNIWFERARIAKPIIENDSKGVLSFTLIIKGWSKCDWLFWLISNNIICCDYLRIQWQNNLTSKCLSLIIQQDWISSKTNGAWWKFAREFQ